MFYHFPAFISFPLIQNTLKVIKNLLNFISKFHQFIWFAVFHPFLRFHSFYILKVIKKFLHFISKFLQFIWYVPIFCFTNSHILRINFCFFGLNYLYIANFTTIFIHLINLNFINHLSIFYIFLFLKFHFYFNQLIVQFRYVIHLIILLKK